MLTLSPENPLMSDDEFLFSEDTMFGDDSSSEEHFKEFLKTMSSFPEDDWLDSLGSESLTANIERKEAQAARLVPQPEEFEEPKEVEVRILSYKNLCPIARREAERRVYRRREWQRPGSSLLRQCTRKNKPQEKVKSTELRKHHCKVNRRK